MLDLDWNAQLRLAPDVLIQDLAGEAVLLDLNTEQYFGLDDVGTRMVQVLTDAASIQAAYESLLAEYEVEPEILRQDLQAFILELQTHGLMQVQ
ncbi:MAG: PqqD family protein [Spirulina sp. SIO3F2]|nr:PqqD family protein [Spirulina sp. SIO3F2]